MGLSDIHTHLVDIMKWSSQGQEKQFIYPLMLIGKIVTYVRRTAPFIGSFLEIIIFHCARLSSYRQSLLLIQVEAIRI